jgi:hypothetical protein
MFQGLVGGDAALAAMGGASAAGARQVRPAIQSVQTTTPLALPRTGMGFTLPLSVGFGGLLTPEEELQRR